jgi:hypothetical protein
MLYILLIAAHNSWSTAAWRCFRIRSLLLRLSHISADVQLSAKRVSLRQGTNVRAGTTVAPNKDRQTTVGDVNIYTTVLIDGLKLFISGSSVTFAVACTIVEH